MQISRLISFLLFTVLAIPLTTLAEAIATVNGVAIMDQKDFDKKVDDYVKRNKVKDTLDLRKELKNYLINNEVVRQKAISLKLDKTEDYRRRLEDARQQLEDVRRRLEEAPDDILRDAFFTSIIKKTPITDAQITARYHEIVKSVKGQKEIHAYQLVVSTETQANEFIAKLKKNDKPGATFEALANEFVAQIKKSHPSGKTADTKIDLPIATDMGWGKLPMMDPLLANTLKNIGKNQYTEKPFRSDAGWHIFKVKDIRDISVPSLDQMKEQITRQLQEEEIAQTVAKLRADAKIQ